MEDYLYPHFFKVEDEHWWFAARQEIILRFLQKSVPPSAKVRLLDVGCGTGAIAARLSSLYEVSATDESSQAIAFCQTRGLTRLFAGPLDKHPDKQPFDVILLLDVIEHADDDAAILVEVRRRLKDHGNVLITVPSYPWLWSIHDVVAHHKRRYTYDTLQAVVTRAGFRIVTMTYFNTILFPLAVASRVRARLRKATKAEDFAIPPRPLNGLLRSVFTVEKHLVPAVRLPFGLSLLCWARRGDS